MLALTECHINEQGIIAGAIGNPIADWTSLSFEDWDTGAPNARSAPHPNLDQNLLRASDLSDPSKGLTIESLLSLRDEIFSKEESYFDRFASPALFFRTPSYDLPPPIQRFSAMDPVDSQESEDDTSAPLVKRRRSHRKYPPLSSEFRIPRMLFEVGKENVWKNQGLELAELVRRSVYLWERGEGQDLSRDGNNRVDLVRRAESGLWGDKEIVEIGHWFVEAFR